MRYFGFPLVLPFLVFGVASCISKDTDVHAGNQDVNSLGSHDGSDTEEPEETEDEVSDGSDDEEDTHGSDTDGSEEPDDEVTEEPDSSDETEDPPVTPEPDPSSVFPVDPPPGPTATTPDGDPSPTGSPAPTPAPGPAPTSTPTSAPTTNPSPTMTPTSPTTPEPVGCGDSWSVSSNGYVRAPGAGGTCWSGYALTYIDQFGSTISPRDFESCGENCQLCISGVVAAEENFGGLAVVGFSVNESTSRGPEALAPGPGPIVVDVSNRGGSTLRVHMSGPNDGEWCSDISGHISGPLPIEQSDFNTECWIAGEGTSYAGEPIHEILLIVSGRENVDVEYDICLNSVTPP